MEAVNPITAGNWSDWPPMPTPNYRGGKCPNCFGNFVSNHFELAACPCPLHCACRELSCTTHLVWKFPDGPALQFWSHALWCFGAYQGSSGVEGKSKKDLFEEKFFQEFQPRMATVSDLTLFCDIKEYEQSEAIAAAFSISRSPMLASKALAFGAPDLFFMLDNGMVWGNFKSSYPTLIPNKLRELRPADYTELKKAVADDFKRVIRSSTTATLRGGRTAAVESLPGLRESGSLPTCGSDPAPAPLARIVDFVMR